MYISVLNTGSGIELVLSTLICLLSVLLFMSPKQICEGRNYSLIKNGMICLALNQVLEFVRIIVFTTNSTRVEAFIFLFYLAYYITQCIAFFYAMQYVVCLLPSVKKIYTYRLRGFFFWCFIVFFIGILSSPITGFAYKFVDGVIRDGIAMTIAYIFRLIMLIVVIINLNKARVQFSSRTARDIMLAVVLPAVFHVAQTQFYTVSLFGISMFSMFSCVFWLHYGGHYEDGEAREKYWVFSYDMKYKYQNEEEFSVLELRIKNLDRLLFENSKDEVRSLNRLLIRGVAAKNLKTAVYYRDLDTYRFICESLDIDDIYNVAGAIREVMLEFLDGKAEYNLLCAKCPEQVHSDRTVIRLFDMTEKRCKRNLLYICQEEDVEEMEFSDRMEHIISGIQSAPENLIVYASPIVDSKSRDITRFDLTSRLQIPGYGIAKASRFIEVAKKNGHSRPITMLVLDRACKFLTENLIERSNIKVVIHVGSKELLSNGFAEDVISIIGKYNLVPETLAFELIFDDMAFDDYEKAGLVVSTLKQYGIVFMLDEFSPENANFKAIIELGIDRLRLKENVLKYANESPKYYDMLGMVIDMIHQYGAKMAFRDIDTEELEELATSLGADYMQGSLYSNLILFGEEVLNVANNWDGYK